MLWVALKMTSPPFPPSPPAGPPQGMNLRRRKATAPLTPSPALTWMVVSSMNMEVAYGIRDVRDSKQRTAKLLQIENCNFKSQIEQHAFPETLFNNQFE